MHISAKRKILDQIVSNRTQNNGTNFNHKFKNQDQRLKSILPNFSILET